MLSSEEFKKFAGEYVVFAHVTTRIKDRKYDGLLQEKGGRGFPHLVALNKDGDVIAALAGERSVAGFRAMMEAGSKFEGVRAKAVKTTDDEIFLLKHDIAMGNAKFDAAKERVAKLKDLTEAQKKEIDGLLLGLEIQAALPTARTPEEAKVQAAAAGKKFAEMWAAGRAPTSDEGAIGNFYSLILEHAEGAKDADLFEKALGKLRETFGSRPQTAGFFKKQEARLAALKAPAAPATPDPEKKDSK